MCRLPEQSAGWRGARRKNFRVVGAPEAAFLNGLVDSGAGRDRVVAGTGIVPKRGEERFKWRMPAQSSTRSSAAAIRPRSRAAAVRPYGSRASWRPSPRSAIGRKSLTLALSVVLHAGLAVAVVVGPLLYMDALPNTSTLKAFFVAPLELAPAPPPPPPPPAGARAVTRAAPRPQPVAVDAFVAPIEVPEEIRPEESLDLGVEGGLPGGVEGGVPGGVVGGIVGGLPEAPPPHRRGSSASVVRSGRPRSCAAWTLSTLNWPRRRESRRS